ncbi:hypothetical protein ABE096_08355 [Robertmurraya massiliosenegalensis]|uniref:hypothetical protein n=1 Tax=Robertmurraya TaxID=2837507 RepID=UPI0039A52372
MICNTLATERNNNRYLSSYRLSFPVVTLDWIDVLVMAIGHTKSSGVAVTKGT